MNAVWNVYVWKYDKLEHVVENIVAESCEQAARRAISALRARPGMYDDPLAKGLSMHMHVGAEWPAGVIVQPVKLAEQPSCARVVCA